MQLLRRARFEAAVAIVISTVVTLAWPAPAGASCIPPLAVPDAIAQADLVVVGTVTATRSRDRIANVAVEEIWKGDVGPTVEVFGGPDREDAATSVDRVYEVGTRYLIFAFEPGAHAALGTFGGQYEDTDCSTTQPWNESLAAFRPATATTVTPPSTAPSPTGPGPAVSSDDGDRSRVLVSTVALVGAAGAGALGLQLRRRRRRVPMRT